MIQTFVTKPGSQGLLVILSSVAVSSCSVERCLSRVRIVKNRLRSTMQDDWFSSLTLLACEQDILNSLTVEEVIDNFARLSAGLRRHLFQVSQTLRLLSITDYFKTDYKKVTKVRPKHDNSTK